jgi:hypothetical protein
MKSHDASSQLGAKQLAGAEVSPKGFVRQIKGVVTAWGPRREPPADGGAPSMPAFRRTAYLAVSKRDLALVQMRSGLLTLRLSDDVLARVPRNQIASLTWKRGSMLSRLAVTFQNGVVWEFDVTQASRSSAEGIVRALGHKALLTR